MFRSLTRRQFLSQSGRAAATVGVAGSLLSACGGTTGKTTSSEPVTLTYGWWSNDPTKDNAMLAWVQDFVHTHPNITIKAEILPWNSYWTKLKTTTAGGNAYDIIGISAGAAAPYFDEGALYDLSQFVDYQDAVKNLAAAPLSEQTWNGKHYGLPVGIYIPLLGYNKNLLQAAGIPFPDPVTPMTFDDFVAMGKKLTKFQNGKAVQYALHPSYFLSWDIFVYLAGGQVYDHPVNPTRMMLNSPEGIDGLSRYQQLFTENISVPANLLKTGPFGSGDLPSLQTGKVAFARTGAFDFQDMATTSTNIGAAPIFSMNGRRAAVGTANSLGIYRKSKHPNEAWEFLKWAVQTPAEISFAKFSDIPADKGAFSQLDTILQPKEYVPTLRSDLNVFVTDVMTPKTQLATVLTDIATDLQNGKITPAQAAAKMEQQGNAVLSAS